MANKVIEIRLDGRIVWGAEAVAKFRIDLNSDAQVDGKTHEGNAV